MDHQDSWEIEFIDNESINGEWEIEFHYPEMQTMDFEVEFSEMNIDCDEWLFETKPFEIDKRRK